ncbi:uncharacterized protein BCR38DRAFT_414788 [Pseudomassariella vexata]|uniref:Uncharacterized protein n=1 Tax=Pseudomassariella vexata TaxID=1141098 RepID=A0A1Y2D9Z4_9PEZI|nr:uncharacterized protein BCR38DRAFT_414788 [Pseudomassariella vexata]ORY55936.1 hypothetical protein BCR38DRAFT_414788 [Pseudomassariella vexata]
MAAYKVHIQPGNFSFSFRHLSGESGMGMISPIWKDADDHPPSGVTRIKLFLHDHGDAAANDSHRQLILQQFREIQDTHLLFLKNIQRICIVFLDEVGRGPQPQTSHSGLPILIQFLIQADLVTQANRQDIVATSSRNIALFDGLAEAFIKAIQQLCSHKSLQYTSMRYLPSKDDFPWEGYWHSLVIRIQKKLAHESVMRPRSGNALSPIGQMRRLTREGILDGTLLFDDTNPEIYLSQHYKSSDLLKLEEDGLMRITTTQILDRVKEDLGRSNSRMKSTDAANQWHTAAAELLGIPFKKQSTKSISILRELDLIPLQNGEWIAAQSATNRLSFPSVDDIIISQDFPLSLINWHAARAQLFTHLGATKPSVKRVRKLIFKKYTDRVNFKSLFDDLDHPQEISMAHLTFLYPVLIDDGSLKTPRSQDVYLIDDHRYGAKKLLCQVTDQDNPDCNALGSVVPFLQPAYLEGPEDQRDTNGAEPWLQWLENTLGVRRRLRLIDRGSITKEFKHIINKRAPDLIGVLQNYWHIIGTDITSNESIRDELSKAKVPCAFGVGKYDDLRFYLDILVYLAENVGDTIDELPMTSKIKIPRKRADAASRIRTWNSALQKEKQDNADQGIILQMYERLKSMSYEIPRTKWEEAILQDLFRQLPRCSNFDVAMVHDELKRKGLSDSTSVSEEKQELWQFNSLLTAETESLDPQPVLEGRIFPVKLLGGEVLLLSAISDFALVDRKGLGDAFAKLVKLLDFTPDEVCRLQPLLHWAGLDDRHLSIKVTEVATPSLDAEGSLQFSRRQFKHRAYALCRFVNTRERAFENLTVADKTHGLAMNYESPRALRGPYSFYQLLRRSEVIETDGISLELQLIEDGRTLRVQQPQTNLHINHSDGSLKIYVPKYGCRQETCLYSKLLNALLKWMVAEDAFKLDFPNEDITTPEREERACASEGSGYLRLLEKVVNAAHKTSLRQNGSFGLSGKRNANNETAEDYLPTHIFSQYERYRMIGAAGELYTTTGSHDKPFYASKAQYKRMQDISCGESDTENLETIYVVFRVFNLSKGSTGLAIYVDPASMNRQGSLKFTVDSWTVIPGETSS